MGTFIKETALQSHLKDGCPKLRIFVWLIYPDGRVPQLAPAYDFVSTIPYIPDDKLALNLSSTKDMQAIDLIHFKMLAAKANVPEFLLLKTVKETVEETQQFWSEKKLDYPLSNDVIY